MNEELNELVRLGRKYKWATGEVRDYLERSGVNLSRTDFYGEIPTVAEIEASFEYAGATGPSDSPAIFDDPRIFPVDEVVRYAEILASEASDFEAPLDDPGSGFYWRNSQFSGTDAVALDRIVRRERPRTVVEIGSGFSTHVTHAALRAIGGSRNLICIDPEPRTEIASLDGIRFLRQPIQAIAVDELNALLEPGDIVFYDGSHTVKTGSDTVYFYLKLLPYLRPSILVHVHDVRLPYPRNKKALLEAKLYWGEQYLLMAHLHNMSRYRLAFASDLLQRRRPDVARRLVGDVCAPGGVSLWLRVQPDDK